MTADIQSLLSLPVQTLAALGGGYICYRLAFVGRNAAHRQVDVVLIVLAFGMIIQMVGRSLEGKCPGNVEQLVGIVVSLCLAALWRALLEGWVRNALRWAKISDHDGQPSAWLSSLARSDIGGASRLIVTMDHGGAYMSDPLFDFKDAPMGPCLLGEDGSIGMYVTHTCGPDDAEWSLETPHCDKYGHLMTFIPASRIRFVEIQRKK